MKPTTIRVMRKLHRWFGLGLAGLICFYCITGLLLNHRKHFGYFINKQISLSRVPQSDSALMREFINLYKQQIGRSDDPTVIRIRDGKTIEFLYGSHGKTTFIIDPVKGEMKKIEKTARQPWTILNRLHKVFKTSPAWLMVADMVAILTLLITCTGLIILKYRPVDWLLVILGSVLPFVFVFI